MTSRGLHRAPLMVCCALLGAMASHAAGEAYTDVHVSERCDLDFPAGRCGGHAHTGVRWTAPKAATVRIRGRAWRIRKRNGTTYVSLWVKGTERIHHGPVHGSSAHEDDFTRMIADQHGDASLLQDIAVTPGDEIVVQIDGNDYTGLELTIDNASDTWDLATDFSDDRNPAGPWAYGEVVVDDKGKPSLKVFESRSGEVDFDLALFGKGQPTWYSKKLPHFYSMMKSRGTMPIQREVRFTSDKTVYVESSDGERWLGRYWAADGTIKLPYEGFAEEAFQIEIDQKPLATGWQFVSTSEAPGTRKGTRHSIVKLANKNRAIHVTVHTVLDGTPILKRWLEITNQEESPVALTGIYPWTGLLVANEAYWGNPSPPKRFDHPFTLGSFTKPDHCWEGWFQWQPLTTPGITEIGCDKGQCYDDPFFIIRNDGTGQYLIGHLAWPANWRMTLDYHRGTSHTLRFRIGPWASNALRVIAPGETIATPAVHLGLVAGDLDTAVQAMQDHIRRLVLPTRKPERAYLVQYALPGDQGYLSHRFGDSSGYTEESVLAHIDLAASIEAELFIMDAGWWDIQGDWAPSAFRFPRGFKPIVEYAHKKNLLFGLYGEIEKAGAASKIARAHPAWIRWYPPYPVLNLAIPEAAEYMEGELTRIIQRYQLDLFRLDFNVPSAEAEEGVSNNLDGMEENNFWRYYDAFYGVFERIHAKYPDLILQQAACGGGRNDLGVVGRFHEQYLTDGLRLPYQIQNYSGQTLALPPEVLIIAHGADGGGSTGSAENLDTNLRIAFTLSTPWLFAGTVAPSIGELSPERRDRYLHYGKIYKRFIRPLLPVCKVYHHAPVTSRGGVESSGWFAMEYASPDRTKGWATLVRIGPSDTDTFVLRPRGLDPAKSYRVTFDRLRTTATIDGFRLIQTGLPIRLEAMASSELLLFDAE